MERWVGRVAVVTGASAGIGEAVAKELTKHGMKVAALARRLERLQKIQEECKNYNGTMKIYKCDVSDENEIASTIKTVVHDFGPISVLVNNAAVFSNIPLTDTSKGTCRKLYETNIIGLVTMTQHVVEIMKNQNINDGHIININSIAGHCILPLVGVANYCASKNAVTVLSESLKNELAALKSKIRVTSISPGLVKTDMAAEFTDNNEDLYPNLSTNDIVECLIFVLSVKPHINISELKLQPVGESVGAFN